MEKMKILIIEDEISICDILSFKLKKEGYDVLYCTKGKDGLESIEIYKPNLIILDLMLPDMSGFDICKEISSRYKIPIIMLTARNDITDKVLGLELGADDYITKPFDIREVAARVKAALRRMENNSDIDDCLELGDIKINKAARMVYKGNKELKFKPKEYELFVLLCENKNRVFTREQLLDNVWGFEYEGGLRTVDVHIQRIRKKIGDNDASFIETVFGVGYKVRC